MNSLLRLYDIKSAKQLEDSEIIKEIVDYSRVLWRRLFRAYNGERPGISYTRA